MINTNLGKIAVYPKLVDSDKTPIIFLHGVYFDHHLWDEVIDSIQDRTTYSVDMPFHGLSKEITKNDWSLNDCADMLIEILESLKLTKVIAIGHSWGSMTILRAANKHPERFEGIGLCNMPFEAASPKQKRMFKLQHTLLFLRKFYTKQAAKSLFGKSTLKENPHLHDHLQRSMNKLKIDDIKQTDKKVILDAEDATTMILNLKVKAIVLKGKEDYVPTPPKIEIIIVDGGHISPLEEPLKVMDLIWLLVEPNRH
jgi:pimeloyl-ACP methyl ester carboxylesterase